MQYTVKNILTILFLLVCSIPFFILNIHSTHSPGGDDYAQYIKEAQNIALGKPYYSSNYVFNRYNNTYAPAQYPPGYPFLLAPVVRIYGIDIRPICYFNSFIATCLLFSFFFFFRKYTGILSAICLSLLISYCQLLIDLKQAVLADTACLLFVMLYLIFRNSKTFVWYRIVLLVAFAAMAMLTRTQAIALLIAELTYVCLYVIKQYSLTKKSSYKYFVTQPSLYIVIGSLLLNLLLTRAVFYTPVSADSFYIGVLNVYHQTGASTVIRDSANFFLQTIHFFFHYDTDSGIRTALVTIMENCGLVLFFAGFIISVSERFSFDDVFFVLMSVMVLLLPIHDVRYFLPSIAIVYYYCYTALEKILPVITGIRPLYVGLGITFICFFAGIKYLKSTKSLPAGYVPEATDWQAFNYLSTHINKNDLIICERPRLITLYTDRRCIIQAWQYPMGFNKKFFDSLGAKYLLVMDKSDDGYYKTYLPQFGHPLDSMGIAPGYTLYTLK